MKCLLVTGARGMLATDVAREFSREFEVKALSRTELDITRTKAVSATVARYRPEAVINCAAFTRVDDCESMKGTAFEVNARGPLNLASACNKYGALLVHVSTDYVFDGKAATPWKEDNTCRPLNVYGESKLQGEIFIRQTFDNYIIIRTSWLFGLHGPNFIKTMLDLSQARTELAVVDDQEGSPTYTRDLARGIRDLMAANAKGVFHCSNSGSCTWFDLCSFVFEKRNITDVRLKPVPTTSFPRLARRPSYSVLDNTRFAETAGYRLRSWQEAVTDYLQELEKSHQSTRAS